MAFDDFFFFLRKNKNQIFILYVRWQDSKAIVDQLFQEKKKADNFPSSTKFVKK